jgi:hypothetical protein
MKTKRLCKKKAREAAEKTLAKALDSKSEAKETNEASEVNKDSMKAGFLEDLEKAKQAQSTAKGAMIAATIKMFTFYSNLLSLESKYLTRSMVSRQKVTHTSTYKVMLWKTQVECLASHLTIASCFTFSLCFPSTRLSKKSTTSLKYLGSPSASMYPSSYGV